jgi:hypothetical protein
MTKYTVEWTCEVDADSPQEAATIARCIMRDERPHRTLDVFGDDEKWTRVGPPAAPLKAILLDP